MYSKEIRILRLENRIELLESRNKDNASVVRKLRRELRNLESAAGGPETV